MGNSVNCVECLDVYYEIAYLLGDYVPIASMTCKNWREILVNGGRYSPLTSIASCVRDIEVFDYFVGDVVPNKVRFATVCMETGSMVVLQKICNMMSPKHHYKLARCAAGWGRVDYLSWMYAAPQPWFGNEVWFDAAKYGQVKVLEWLVDNSQDMHPAGIVEVAVQYGQVEVCKFLQTMGAVFYGPELMVLAASYDCVSTMKYLNEFHSPYTIQAMDAAAEWGCVSAAKCLIDSGIIPIESYKIAAKNFRIDVIKLFLDNDVPCGKLPKESTTEEIELWCEGFLDVDNVDSIDDWEFDDGEF